MKEMKLNISLEESLKEYQAPTMELLYFGVDIACDIYASVENDDSDFGDWEDWGDW